MSEPRASSSDPYVRPQQGDAWAAEAASQGQVGTQRLIAVDTIPASDEVRDALHLQPADWVVVRRRLILADDQPVEIAESYYPATIATGTPLAENKKIRGGAVRVLAEAGHPLDESIEQVTAARPSPEEAALLQVREDEPLIIVRRASAPTGRPPAEYAVNRMVASRAAPLEYRMRNTAK